MYDKRGADRSLLLSDVFNYLLIIISEITSKTFWWQPPQPVEQSEKEVTDLHSRISQGMREAKKNGTKIGLSKGTSLTTKKSIVCKGIIQKHSEDLGGSLEATDAIKLYGCSRNSHYMYRRKLKIQVLSVASPTHTLVQWGGR